MTTKKGRQDQARTGESRRRWLKNTITVAGAGAAIAASGGATAARRQPTLAVDPKYFPRRRFRRELELAGKCAVITGASRGIGRATAELLTARGLTVFGTSRNVANVPNPPTSFPLLDLDITDPVSIQGFVGALATHPAFPGSVDILVNNAGRFVIGTAVPLPPSPVFPDPLSFYMDAIEQAMATNYWGHVRTTNSLLPLMTPNGYARILFNVSVSGYGVGGSATGEATGASFLHAYASGKRATLAYANNLRGILRSSGSHIQVSTVNPQFVSTGLADGLNPIFTEPVDANGNAPFNPTLQAVLDGIRAGIVNGLNPRRVARAFWQLLSMNDPLPNVIAGSDREPFASQGQDAIIRQSGLEENAEAAASFVCA